MPSGNIATQHDYEGYLGPHYFMSEWLHLRAHVCVCVCEELKACVPAAVQSS